MKQYFYKTKNNDFGIIILSNNSAKIRGRSPSFHDTFVCGEKLVAKTDVIDVGEANLCNCSFVSNDLSIL